MNAKDAVVKRFWELCEKDNIKKNELARRAGISPSSLWNLLGFKETGCDLSGGHLFCIYPGVWWCLCALGQ